MQVRKVTERPNTQIFSKITRMTGDLEENKELTTLAAGIILFRSDAVKDEGGVDSVEPSFLLLKCSKKHHWSPPKGISEKNEGRNTLETAYRETMEETGIKPEQIKIYDDFLKEIRYEAWNKKKTVFYYLGECEESQIKISDEHSEYKWANINQVKQLVEFESLIQVFTDAFERISREKKP
ncbi:5'-nucleosyl-tetraphosphatase [Cryptosporidium felis]|nr:5'-nucleosyl-tetraphosphatase [Cryptosporidium felis]